MQKLKCGIYKIGDAIVRIRYSKIYGPYLVLIKRK